MSRVLSRTFFFFFNDTATTEIYTLSLHDALPIFTKPTATGSSDGSPCSLTIVAFPLTVPTNAGDRKSTRLNSSHLVISYAVFCLKKKKNNNEIHRVRNYHRTPNL